MDVPRLIRETVAAAEARVTQALRNLIQITTVSRSTAQGEADGADGWPDAGKPYQRSTRRMQHFGFRSRPPKNTAAVMLLVGGSSSSEVTVAEGSDGYGPTDLASGAASLFSSGDARVVVDGADVTVNDGNKKVATDQTPLSNGTIAMTAATAGAPPVTTVAFTFTPPGGTPSVIGTLVFTSGVLTGNTPGSVAMTGKVNGGSPHFLAPQGT